MIKPFSIDAQKIGNGLILLFAFLFSLNAPSASLVALLILLTYLISGDYANKWAHFKNHRVLHLSLALFLWTVFAAVYSKAQPEFLNHDLFKYKKLLLAIPFLYYLNPSHKGKMLLAFALSEFVAIAISLYKGHGFVEFIKTGQFVYTNGLRIYISEGMFLALVVFMALHWFFIEKRLKALSLIALAILLIHVAFINGRMGLLSLGFVLLYAVFLIQKSTLFRGVFLSLIAALSLVIYFKIPLVENRVQRTVAEASQVFSDSKPESIRLQYFQLSLNLFKANPILGQGPGSFHTATVQSGNPDGEFKTHLHTHNEYLTLLSQYGLIGFGLFIALVVHLLKDAYQHNDVFLRHAGIVGLLLFMLNSLTDSMLYMEGYFFVFLLSIAARTVHVDRSPALSGDP